MDNKTPAAVMMSYLPGDLVITDMHSWLYQYATDGYLGEGRRWGLNCGELEPREVCTVLQIHVDADGLHSCMVWGHQLNGIGWIPARWLRPCVSIRSRHRLLTLEG